AAAAGRAAARRDQREHRLVYRGGERVGAERVELGPAQRRALDRQLERLALRHDDRVTQVVGRAGVAPRPAVAPPVSIGTERAWLPAPALLTAVLARPPTRRAGIPGVRPDPGQHEPLVHQAQPAVQVDRVPGAQALVLD